ncbi:immunoglobulin superfamily member 8 [Protopterus annectens]|uniref:immunoglobulin superfamily member 8 n=1 Tax=Protopterus annectens TaxID=7888 RepID=UPI001CFB1A33|nr:immunoglobulin superfamily member 8 [Protopterus annectens]
MAEEGSCNVGPVKDKFLASLLSFGLTLWITVGVSEGRLVKVPQGPLFRVEGTSISIPCNVSEYEGPSLQHFEWFIYHPDKPDIPIGIISSKDPSFPYAIYFPRVKSNEVQLKRVQDNIIELQIKALKPEDAGEYECHTPSTDKRYFGSYSDKVHVKVLPDELRVGAEPAHPAPSLARQAPRSRSLMEGEELELTCTALTKSQEHTHLSVTFGVTNSSSSSGQEIISIRRDFSIEAGTEGSYAARYQNREILVGKAQRETYVLVISRVRPEDKGLYYCTAAEWIRDPEGNWQQIVERTAELAQISVQPLSNILQVSAHPAETRLTVRDTLELFCEVKGVSNASHTIMALKWTATPMKGSPQEQLVAVLGPDGIVTLGQHYSNADGTRDISLERTGIEQYRLRIHSTQPGDLGTYYCSAIISVQYPNGSLYEVAHQKSKGLKVVLKSEEVTVDAIAWSGTFPYYRLDTLELFCNVSVGTSQPVSLEISWLVESLKDKEMQLEHKVASIDRDGVTQISKLGPEVSMSKVGPQSYRLRIYSAQHEDEGDYVCNATAWVRYPDQSWYRAASVRSTPVTVYMYARVWDTLMIPFTVGVVSALFVGITIISTVTCCYLRKLAKR